MTDATPPFSWRSIILPAYLPTLLFSIGEGAIIPVIPVVATERGASLAIAGLIAAMIMVGELVGDLPAGWLVARIGERNAMIGASMLAVIGVLIALASPTVFALGIGMFLLGLATAVFGLARHAFLTSYVPEAGARAGPVDAGGRVPRRVGDRPVRRGGAHRLDGLVRGRVLGARRGVLRRGRGAARAARPRAGVRRRAARARGIRHRRRCSRPARPKRMPRRTACSGRS